MQTISPFLWFDDDAEAAAQFYVSLFPGSSVLGVTRYPEGSGERAGQAMTVHLTLDGLELYALNGGPAFSFTEAVSLFVRADTQDEIDRLWTALTADGGEPSMCGWLKDRWGLSWQVVPSRLLELLADPDPARAARVTQAMLAMGKIELAALEAAALG